MTERVFAITLTQGTAFLNGEACKETKGILTKNRCEAIGFTPETLFKIAKYHDPKFCAKREEIFVLLNS